MIEKLGKIDQVDLGKEDHGINTFTLFLISMVPARDLGDIHWTITAMSGTAWLKRYPKPWVLKSGTRS
jgi:hypothetical protein